MKAIKIILNVLGVLLSVPVALLLAVWLIVAPVLMSAAAWLQPDTVKQIIRDVNYEALVESFGGDAAENLPQMEDFIKTDFMAQVTELYMEEIFAQVDGKPVGTVFHEQAVRDALDANMAELLPIFRAMLEEEAGAPVGPDVLSDEDLRKMIQDELDEQNGNLLQGIPTAEELGIDVPEIRLAIQLLRSYRLKLAVVLMAALLSVLLVLFRMYHLRGFIWLGVVYFITAGLTLFTGLSVNMAVTLMPPEVAVLGEQLLNVMAGKMLIAAGVYAVVAVGSIAASVVYHRCTKAKKSPLPEWN